MEHSGWEDSDEYENEADPGEDAEPAMVPQRRATERAAARAYFPRRPPGDCGVEIAQAGLRGAPVAVEDVVGGVQRGRLGEVLDGLRVPTGGEGVVAEFLIGKPDGSRTREEKDANGGRRIVRVSRVWEGASVSRLWLAS